MTEAATSSRQREIRENLEQIRENIAHAARASGREPQDVKLIAVSKKKPAKDILAALAAGQTAFGENYMQEALQKIETVKDVLSKEPEPSKPEWHFIGQIQSRKCRDIAEAFDLIHSLDRESVADKLNTIGQDSDRTIKALVQINLHHENSKGGILPADAYEFFSYCSGLRHLNVLGLMTLPSFKQQQQDPRPAFANLRTLLEKINQADCYHLKLQELSMGMSADYAEAIQEGATLVRVGTAVFGER